MLTRKKKTRRKKKKKDRRGVAEEGEPVNVDTRGICSQHRVTDGWTVARLRIKDGIQAVRRHQESVEGHRSLPPFHRDLFLVLVVMFPLPNIEHHVTLKIILLMKLAIGAV